MDQKLKANLTSSKLWVRMLYMLFIALCVHIASFVVGVVVIIQFIMTLLNGSTNTRLKTFGQSLVYYIRDGLTFLTFNGEEKPFPFADWPEVEIEETDELTSEVDVPVESENLEEASEALEEGIEEELVEEELVEEEPLEKELEEVVEASDDKSSQSQDEDFKSQTDSDSSLDSSNEPEVDSDSVDKEPTDSDDSARKDLNKQQKE